MARSERTRLAKRVDARFVLGIIMVVASVLGVSVLVNSLNRTIPVYVVGVPIATGDSVPMASLRIAQLNLGASADQYLTPGDDVRSWLAARPMQPGELVAKSALTTALGADSITTVIPVSGPLPSSVSVGHTVDVWAASDGSLRLEEAAPPAVVISGAEVVSVTASEGFAASGTTNVELRLDRSKLQGILMAQSLGLAFTIVSVGAAS